MLVQGIREPYSQTRLSSVDGRVKLLLTVAALFAATSTRFWYLPFCFGSLSLIVLILVGVNLQSLWRRFRPILVLAGFIGLTQVFMNGHTVWFKWHLFSMEWTAYKEGVDRGALFAARIFGGFSVMSVLTFTTTVQEWIQALAWFRVPQSIIEMMTLAYSSLFTLLEELDRLQKAQHMRLGYGSWWRSMQSVGAVGGILFIRVFDKSMRLWQAMRCRGYEGSICVQNEQILTQKETLISGLGLMMILGSWLIGR